MFKSSIWSAHSLTHANVRENRSSCLRLTYSIHLNIHAHTHTPYFTLNLSLYYLYLYPFAESKYI